MIKIFLRLCNGVTFAALELVKFGLRAQLVLLICLRQIHRLQVGQQAQKGQQVLSTFYKVDRCKRRRSPRPAPRRNQGRP